MRTKGNKVRISLLPSGLKGVQMKKVYIWDRDAESASLIGSLIEEEFDCTWESPGQQEEPLKRIADRRYDLILMGSEESELIKHFHTGEANRETPVILLTGKEVIEKEKTDDASTGSTTLSWDVKKQEGYTDYLIKPFQMNKMIEILEKYGLEKRQDIDHFQRQVLSPLPVLLVVDRQSRLFDILKERLTDARLYHAKEEHEAFLDYTYLRDEITLVLFDTKTIEWKKLLQKMQSVSDAPQFILISETQGIQEAVGIGRLGGSGYLEPSLAPEKLALKMKNYVAKAYPEKNKIDLFQKWLEKHKDLEEKEINHYFEQITRKLPPGGSEFLGNFDLQKTPSIEEIAKKAEGYWGKKIEDMPKGKLLIVEDEKEAMIQLDLLFKNHFEVLSATTGSELMRILEQMKDIDVILLDVKLPDIDTDKVYDKIDRLKGDARVIVVTAYSNVDKAMEFFRQQAFNYVTKPYDIYDLYRNIGQAWLDRLWPILRGCINLQTQPVERRLYLLSELIEKRRRREEEVYLNDIHSLFPEIYLNTQLNPL